ncbi:MAG: hypothetical protein ABW221_03405 [Vicinamibacteria bacterium]
MPGADGAGTQTLGRPEYTTTLIARAMDGDAATTAMLLSFAREHEPHRLRTWARALLRRAGLGWEPPDLLTLALPTDREVRVTTRAWSRGYDALADVLAEGATP